MAIENAFGVYVHWPFCAAKCPYCDFNSHVRHTPIDQGEFVKAYEQEIAHMAALAPGRTVTSIFFGGGTPSLMEPGTVGSILDSIAKHWTVSDAAEITLEANPQSVDSQNFLGFRDCGVNRVSMGVQSFDDRQLKFLGRLHNVAEAKKAIALARDIFPRMSFDMIYARPNQSASEWESELKEAISLAADHLSLYQLTIEQGTPFYELRQRGKLKVPDTEHAASLYELTLKITAQAGLPAYEISNHARPGAECQHNLVYWRYQDYAGIGPGAHGRLTTNEGKTATATELHPETWWKRVKEAGHGIVETEVLDREAAGDEFLLMGLRLKEGIDPARFEEIAGHHLDGQQIAQLMQHGFIEFSKEGRLRATQKGFLLLDAVVADLAIASSSSHSQIH